MTFLFCYSCSLAACTVHSFKACNHYNSLHQLNNNKRWNEGHLGCTRGSLAFILYPVKEENIDERGARGREGPYPMSPGVYIKRQSLLCTE